MKKEYNEQLLQALIYETNLAKSGGLFEWNTEWLGYLPYGQYQWIEINNKGICNKFKFSWEYKDLVELESLGLLMKLSEENFSEDKKIVKYEIDQELLKNATIGNPLLTRG